MKTLKIIAGLAAFSVLQPGVCLSRTLELSKATCAEFVALPATDKEQIVLWLAGFYAGAAQRPNLDTDLLSKAPAALDELCAKTPGLALIGAETRPLLLKQPAP